MPAHEFTRLQIALLAVAMGLASVALGRLQAIEKAALEDLPDDEMPPPLELSGVWLPMR